MNNMFLYFAYGSNMNPARMAKRCPGAIDLGGAVLRNHRVVERLYADIDFTEGAVTESVLYVITEKHLKSLDRFEGYPSVYRRIWVDVEFEDCTYQAMTYEMSYGRPRLPETASFTPKNTGKSVQPEQELILSKTISQKRERANNGNSKTYSLRHTYVRRTQPPLLPERRQHYALYRDRRTLRYRLWFSGVYAGGEHHCQSGADRNSVG